MDKQQSKSDKPSRSPFFAAVAIGLCVLVELLLLATRGRFEMLFTEFELDLSSVTQLAIGWILPTLLATVILMAIIKEFVLSHRQMRDRLNWIVLLAGASCLAVYLAGICGPMLTLVQALS